MKPGTVIAVFLLLPKLVLALDGKPSDIDLNAFASITRSATVESIYSEINHRELAEAGIIEEWRERVYKTVVVNSSAIQADRTDDSRIMSASELDERTSEGRKVSKAVLKETLKFAQERLPELEKMIRILRFEVSTDMISQNETHMISDIEPASSPELRAAHQAVAENRFFMKTGLRVPVDGGKLNVFSETEATYGNVSSYFRVQLHGRYDSRLGLVYALGKDMQVQVERQVNHGNDSPANESAKPREDMNLIQLVCAF